MGHLLVGIPRYHYNKGHFLDAKKTQAMEKMKVGKKGTIE